MSMMRSPTTGRSQNRKTVQSSGKQTQFMSGAPKIVNTDERRQQLENARAAENLKKIQGMLSEGIPFLKHNRKGKIKKRILRSEDVDATKLLWTPIKGEESRSVFASSDQSRRVRDVVMVQAANEADPEMPQYGGTRTLRKSAGRKAVFKSFSLHFIDRTLDLEFDTVAKFTEVYEGIKLLVSHHKMKTAQEEFALFYADQNHKNKMAWVPTTDAQARVYFYNLYTRETSWVPPAGAPRVELEWWEKSFAEKKRAKQRSEGVGDGGDNGSSAMDTAPASRRSSMDMAPSSSSNNPAGGAGIGEGRETALL